ncbi:NADP-dependent isocitrate dehydrogenase [Candidatus Kapabacteria bacterium]|nr:NADP-dependent isocitrate dehydrogenase [Candidatus Kapabacteria bacterium]
MSSKIPITIARGDGIGPEIMDATLRILEAAGAPLEYEEIQIGEQVYLSGELSGISKDSWDTIRRNKAFLKAPITTPQGGGYKSLNVTIRKSLGLYANVRPCKTFKPYIPAYCNDMDMVIIRENEEDLYAGIEHQQTSEVVQCLKLISRPGCEKIIRYAFEYAKTYDRKKVTCMTKDNIMKHTDGLFHEVFKEISKEYPDIETEHRIIDIGSAVVATKPEILDVVVTLNLYGDIISDIMAQVAGSVGLSGSANVGSGRAMFEAIHGSAPDIAGKDMANPSGILHGAILMLDYLGLSDYAKKIEAAALKTLEEGIHTGDLYQEGISTKKVGTKEFTDSVISNLGKSPNKIQVKERNAHPIEISIEPTKPQPKKLVGIDLFIDWNSDDRNPDVLGKILEDNSTDKLKLKMITNRGVKVYPDGMPETFKTDHWRCRYVSKSSEINNSDILELLSAVNNAKQDVIKTENLYEIAGERAYSLGQGE